MQTIEMNSWETTVFEKKEHPENTNTILIVLMVLINLLDKILTCNE